MTPDAAQSLALRALTWMAGDPERMGAFLGASGLSAGDLRTAADDPGFLGAVLDFLLSDEGAVLAFADAEGIAPDAPMAARAALPGGADVHWT